MTHHLPGSLKIQALLDVELLTDLPRGSRGRSRCIQRLLKRQRDEYSPGRVSRSSVKPAGTHKYPVVLADQNELIDNLLDADHWLRRSPTERTLHERYVIWCQARGRRDIFNRRLARKYLKCLIAGKP